MARWLNLVLQPTKTGESVFFDSESGLRGIGDIYCWVCPVLVFGLKRKEVSEGQCVFRSEI